MVRIPAIGLSLVALALAQAQVPPARDQSASKSQESGQNEPDSFRGKLVLFGVQRTVKDDPTGRCILSLLPDGEDWQTILELKKSERIVAGRVAPNGRSLAFSVQRDGQNQPEVWVLGPEGRRVKVAEDGIVTAWSPDGTRLACSRGKYGDWESFLVDVAKKEEERLPLPKTDVVEDWSPDVQLLTVLASNPDEQFKHPNPEKGTYPLRQVYFWNLKEPQRQEFTTGPLQDNLRSRFSPDGKRVAYHQRRHQDSDLFHSTRVRACDGKGEQEVIQFDKLRQAGGYQSFRPSGFPCWSPDGKSIVAVGLKQQEVTSAHGVMTVDLGMELVCASLEKGVEKQGDLKAKGVAYVKCINWR